MSANRVHEFRLQSVRLPCRTSRGVRFEVESHFPTSAAESDVILSFASSEASGISISIQSLLLDALRN